MKPTVLAISAKLLRPLFPAVMPSAAEPPSAARFPEPHACSAHFVLRNEMQSRGSGRSPEETVVVTIIRFAPHPKWAVTALLPLLLFVTATKAQQLGSSSSHSLRSILWSSINKQLFRGQPWALAQVLRSEAVLFVNESYSLLEECPSFYGNRSY